MDSEKYFEELRKRLDALATGASEARRIVETSDGSRPPPPPIWHESDIVLVLKGLLLDLESAPDPNGSLLTAGAGLSAPDSSVYLPAYDRFCEDGEAAVEGLTRQAAFLDQLQALAQVSKLTRDALLALDGHVRWIAESDPLLRGLWANYTGLHHLELIEKVIPAVTRIVNTAKLRAGRLRHTFQTGRTLAEQATVAVAAEGATRLSALFRDVEAANKRRGDRLDRLNRDANAWSERERALRLLEKRLNPLRDRIETLQNEIEATKRSIVRLEAKQQKLQEEARNLKFLYEARQNFDCGGRRHHKSPYDLEGNKYCNTARSIAAREAWPREDQRRSEIQGELAEASTGLSSARDTLRDSTRELEKARADRSGVEAEITHTRPAVENEAKRVSAELQAARADSDADDAVRQLIAFQQRFTCVQRLRAELRAVLP